MLSIEVICIGKLKEDYLKSSISEYSKRLSKYCQLDIVELPDEKIPERLNAKLCDEIKSKECDSIIRHLKKDSFVIALDLSGKQLSSEDFSSKIEHISMFSSHITFVIGGSLGVNEKVLNCCDERLCFSKMTFPHQLIRVFLLEQIFRAFKIAKRGNLPSLIFTGYFFEISFFK